MATSRKPRNDLSKGEQSRLAIVSAAYSLIIQQGYAATSMRQIAEKAGLALGGIYNHFSSKDEIFQAILEERYPLFQLIPVLGSLPGETVDEFVGNAAHMIVDELGRHPEFLNLVLVEIVEFKTAHVPVMLRKHMPQILLIAKRMRRLRGRVRRIPPFVLARAFFGMFFSYYITELLLAKSLPKQLRQGSSMDHFVQIFLHGILAEEAT